MSGDSPRRREAGAREPGGSGRGRGARRGVGGAQGGGVPRPGSSKAAFSSPKGVACRGLGVLPSTPERGREEGMSEWPEIDGEERQRCRMRTAGPPPATGCSYCSRRSGCGCRGVLHSRTLQLPLVLAALRRGRIGRTGHLPEPAGGARAQESWMIPAPRARLGPASSWFPNSSGRPPSPGRRSEPGRRVSTAQGACRRLLFLSSPPPHRGCLTTHARAGVP